MKAILYKYAPVLLVISLLLTACKVSNNEDLTPSQFAFIKEKAKTEPKWQYTLSQIYTSEPAYKNPTLAFYWVKKAAENGVLFAKTDLGFDYGHGIGTAADQKQAVFWLEQGAKGGDVVAMADIGLRYYYGYGTQKNIPLAIDWFKKALASFAHEKMSLYMLAKFYLTGTGVKQDTNKGIELLNTLSDVYYDSKDFPNKALYKKVFVAYEKSVILGTPVSYPDGISSEMIEQAKLFNKDVQQAVSVTERSSE